MHYLFRGFSLIFQRELRSYVILPIALNFILFIVMWAGAIHYFSAFLHHAEASMPSWLTWLNYLIWPLFVLTMLFFTAYTYTLVSNWILSPFLGVLSEKTQDYLNGMPIPPINWGQMIKDVPGILLRQVRLVLYYLPRAIGLLIVTIIPGINVIAGILWFFFGGWMLAVQYMDYPIDNNRMPFAQTLKQLRSHRMNSLGFGVASLFISAIPIMNIFLIPAAVAGATALYVEKRLD